jgi:hypothetical protein
MAKRKKPNSKAPERSGVVSVVTLPGGRKAEIVREGDPDGRPVAHSRTIDTLGRMRKSGSITPSMHDAARDFHAQFTIAALDTMPGMTLVRVSGGRGTTNLTERQVAARQHVHRALETLGGINGPAGSCVWHVVGLEISLREWARRQGWNGRIVHANQAPGILVAALGVLVVHYGYEQPRSLSYHNLWS